MPFSYGICSCVGQNLANVTMITFIATICSNFSLKLAPEMGSPTDVEASAIVLLTLQPQNSILLQCAP
ncbi:hypothetical protein WJX74_002163 [Apatococcus lobatus]|uniref:Uncharacterized protein n=1 Tax=Apatococcus lobatus TaxID=904363 RepID=A0AAW1QJJ2_9CHLO